MRGRKKKGTEKETEKARKDVSSNDAREKERGFGKGEAEGRVRVKKESEKKGGWRKEEKAQEERVGEPG